MKKIISLLIICFITMGSIANNSITDSTSKLNFINFNESNNQIVVKLTTNQKSKEFVYNYNSKEELFRADFESIIKSIGSDIGLVENEFCEVTISVTVRIGWDSNFISATVSLKASCATWKEELRKLKREVEEILRN